MQKDGDTKRLFVIGANSVVGRLLRACWAGCPVTWCARGGAVDVTWDLNDGAAALGQHLSGHDAVLCLAGATPGVQDFSLNVAVGEAVVRAASEAGCPQVLLASSMAVYGAGIGKLSESSLAEPLGAYGSSKLAMEEACLGAAGVTALRLGNVVGADMLFRNIAAGQPIVIDQFPDGRTPARSYIDPPDLARVVNALIGRDVPPLLNVAAAPGHVDGRPRLRCRRRMGHTARTRDRPALGRNRPQRVAPNCGEPPGFARGHGRRNGGAHRGYIRDARQAPP